MLAQMPTASSPAPDVAWDEVRERLHERGLRWTPQRRLLVDVLSQTDGHITGAELVERCRQICLLYTSPSPRDLN